MAASTVAGVFLAAVAGSPPASAAAAPGKPAPRAAAVPLGVDQALIKAKRTGKPVEATGATTSTSSFTARPDGTVELTQSAAPTRTRVDGQWKNLDPTLVQHADGSITAAVTTNPVRLSAGGTGPLAEMTSGDRSIALTAPMTLPKPTLSGPTATYAEVLPGVDLTVRVTGEGAFSHVFVVKNPAAATDPRLSTLELATAGRNVTLAADAAGNISGRDRSGRVVLTAPAPVMWDSGTATTNAVAPDGRSATSSPAAPGPGAKTAPIKVAVKPGKLRLTPDRALLKDADTVYPVYIDPTFNWSSYGAGKGGWATISYQHQTTNFWKTTPDPDDRMQVGNSGEQRSNTLINFPVPHSLLAGAEIYDAIFKITNTWSWSCTDKTVHIYGPDTPLSQSNAKWDYWEDVTKGTPIASESFAYGYSGCAANAASFNITSKIRDDVADKRGTRTLWMVAANEASDPQSWKEFLETSPTLTIRYNHTPNTPTDLRTSPATSCTAASPTVVGDTDVTLYAAVSDPNKGTLGVNFRLWKASDPAQTPIVYSDPNLLTYSSGSSAVRIASRATLAEHAKDSAQRPVPTTFAWKVQVTDFRKTSAWSVTCKFIFDATRAGPPQIADLAQVQSRVGEAFTVSVSPPTDGTKPSHYVTQLNAAPPVTRAAAADGTLNFQITPTRLTNTLAVTSVTAAGKNFGETDVETFNSAAPATAATDGDLTGDNRPDLLTAGSANNLKPGLWLAENNGEAGINPNITNIGTRGNGATGNPADFDGAQVLTGRFLGNQMQDILAYYPAGANPGEAIIIEGNGDGTVLTADQSGEQFKVQPASLLDEYNRSPIQLATVVDSDGVDPHFPDLIGTSGDATNGYQLTYYRSWIPMTGGFLGGASTGLPTPTGGTDWNNWTIVTAQAGVSTSMFLWNRTTGALHLWSDLLYNPDTGQLTYTARTLAASGWNTGASLSLRAGDVDQDGDPDLWTTGTSSDTTTWLVTSLQAGSGTVAVQARQTLITSDHTWKFDDLKDGSVSTAADVSGGKPLSVEVPTGTVGSNAIWRAGQLFSPVVIMNTTDNGTEVDLGKPTALVNSSRLIDTSASFTISVWAQPTAAGGVILSEDGANASRFLLWNNASDNTWRFGLGNADSGWSYTQVVTPAGAALGVWTHLVATYNAQTRTISLYVDGIHKGSAQYTAAPTWPSTGKFVVGRYLYQGAHTAHYAGMLSNLQVWKRALTPTQVGATNTTKNGSLNPFGAVTWTPPGTGTAQTDVYAVDADGRLWRYRKQPAPATGFTTPRLVSTGWNQFTAFGVADMDHDGYQDLVTRDNASCDLQVFRGTADDLSPTPTFFGSQWCNYRPYGVADYNRDGYQDVFTADSAGNLWVYPGDLADGKLTRIDVGDGWSTNMAPFGIANVVGDTTPDVYGRQTSTGLLKLYDLPAGATGIKQVGDGWATYTSFGLTDYNRDGKPDVIARDSGGTLWLYPGTTGGMLGARTLLTQGW